MSLAAHTYIYPNDQGLLLELEDKRWNVVQVKQKTRDPNDHVNSNLQLSNILPQPHYQDIFLDKMGTTIKGYINLSWIVIRRRKFGW